MNDVPQDGSGPRARQHPCAGRARLALQSVALGYDQPLTGVWVAQPDGPRILRVRSGEYEVAEFVDRDRDDRVEVLYVVQPF